MSSQVGSGHRPEPEYQGCYLSGTATYGDWMCWSTTQDFSQKKWTVERAPTSEANPGAGSFLFAGVTYRRHQNDKMETGRPITIITKGYHPEARINVDAMIDIGHPLWMGGGSGVAGRVNPYDPAPGNIMGTVLEAVSSIATTVRRKVVIRDF